MSTLTSSSSIAEIYASYDANASYEEDQSPTKARAFVTACRFLMRRASRSAKGGRGGAEQEFDLEQLRREVEDARLWLSQNSNLDTSGTAGPSVLDADFTDFDARS